MRDNILPNILLFMLAVMCLFMRPAYAVMEDYPSIKLQGLDKSVGRTVTFEAKVGDTIQYGPLFVKIHACRKAPPIEKPESAAFLQIWEVPPGQEKSEWVFSGWMFASSPALSAMDHPVYDVWVIECTGRDDLIEVIPEEKEGAQSSGEDAGQPVVDSEAEDQSQEPPAQATQPLPSATQQGQEQPTSLEQGQENLAEQPAQKTPVQQDDGFTAYDLMKQQNEAASPSPKSPQTPYQEPANNTESPIY